jgi:hypothetical protein
VTRALYRDREYELVNYLGLDAEFVLRDDAGDVIVFEDHAGEVEVRCDRCGRWTRNIITFGTDLRWVCADTACYDLESAAERAAD